nr:short-chain dehydrogenase [Pseudomonas sp.]
RRRPVAGGWRKETNDERNLVLVGGVAAGLLGLYLCLRHRR